MPPPTISTFIMESGSLREEVTPLFHDGLGRPRAQANAFEGGDDQLDTGVNIDSRRPAVLPDAFFEDACGQVSR
jgi:hypothetical protein